MPSVRVPCYIPCASLTPAGSLVIRSTGLSVSFRPAEATFLALGARPKRAAARHRPVEVIIICGQDIRALGGTEVREAAWCNPALLQRLIG